MIKPYFETELGKMYCGDALDILPTVPDNSIDMVFTDPPYGEDYDYRDSNFVDSKKGYYENLDKLLRSVYLRMKNTSSIYLKHSSRQINKLLPIMDNFFIFKNVIVWPSMSQAHPDMNYDSYYEPLYFYTKTENYYFNKRAEFRARPPNYWSGEGKEFVGLLCNCWYDVKKIAAGCLPPEGGQKGNLKLHPCSMPVKLAARAINVSSKENDIILDPFLGSGTTAVACEKLNRRWIGIEISEEYCAIAKARIQAEYNQRKLF